MTTDVTLTSYIHNPWDGTVFNTDQLRFSYADLGFIPSTSDSYKSTSGDIFKVFVGGVRIYRSSDADYAGGTSLTGFLEDGDVSNSKLNGLTTVNSAAVTWGSTSDTVWTIDTANQYVFLDQSAITATALYGSLGKNVTFTSGTTIVELRRGVSDESTPSIDFSNASILTEQDLDNSSKNVFHLAQQAVITADNSLPYNIGTSAYEAYQPGTTVKRTITQVADPVSDYDAVNKGFISTNLPNITTVAGIAGNVTTVAGISANVTTVAGVSANVTTVATNIASVNTVATDIAKVIVVADDLSEAISEIETAALDLQETTSEIDTVSNSIANVNTVGTAIANVNTVAGISGNVTTVAGISGNVTTVAGISANTTTVAGISANVTAVAGNNANVTKVANIDANVTKVADIDANVTTVAGIGTNGADVTTVAGISGNVTTVAGISANVTTVAGISANVTTVAGISANVTTVANNLSSINDFVDKYRIASSAPSSDNDDGDLYYNTATNQLNVHDGSAWGAIGQTEAQSIVTADNSATAMAIALG